MSQGELFPYLAPETILAALRQLERRVLAIGPELSPRSCEELLGELAITSIRMDRIEHQVLHSRAYRERQAYRPVLGLAQLEKLHRWPDLALERRRHLPAWATRHRSSSISDT